MWMILRRRLLLVARSLASLLYRLGPTDAASVAAGVLLLAATAMLASYIPARRASRIDPITALRNE